MMFIDKTETVHTGGGCWVDVIHLPSGQVIGVTDESIVLYESFDAFCDGCGELDQIFLDGES